MPSKISIKEMLAATAANKTKSWSGHDRSHTVGASEIGSCLRKLWFAKHGTAPDEDYVESRGAMDRGNLIESAYWEPGIRAALPDGVSFLYAGDAQRTMVNGYLSATPDGMLAGVSRDALAHLGVADIESDELLTECKSADPRAMPTEPKPEHTFQLQQQLGLVHACTNHRPMYGLLSYINAAWLDDVREFAVRFDPAVYDAGKARALYVFSADSAVDLPPEGKLSGARECGYCPFASRCRAETAFAVPQAEVSLTPSEEIEIARLARNERALRDVRERAEKEHAAAAEAIKSFLRTTGTRRVRTDAVAVSYTRIDGRKTLSRKAMADDGIDVSRYEIQGEPSERLNVTLK